MKEITIKTVDNELTISQPKKTIKLENYPEINPEIAWELANLVRIAATDYECFKNWFHQREGCQDFLLEEGKPFANIQAHNSFLYAQKDIKQKTIAKYTILTQEDKNNQQIIEQFSQESYYQYKILKTYEYISYYPSKFKVDNERFGFIAERQEGNRKNIFVVFRGTQTPAEWFDNFQFKQIDFLSRKNNTKGINETFGKISLGFNKMYTEFHPGILIDHELINKISQALEAEARTILEKIDKFKLEKKSIYESINEFFSNVNEDNTNTNVYVTGHSLGGALATIAAMDIAAKDKLKNTISLYTFASPRVGNNTFADKFNEFVSQEKLKGFRFANSEDIVPTLPFPVWFQLGVDLDKKTLSKLNRAIFNEMTEDVFEDDYQHIGIPIYFTHQARRLNNDGTLKPTATVGDNHNMTRTYCGGLSKNQE